MKLVLAFLLSFSTLAIEMGAMAPDFTLKGSPKEVQLHAQNGKYVVLEWYNDGCPFVRKHYDSKNMQMLQKKYAGKVSWLTINSSAEGKQGFIADTKAASKKYTKEQMKSMSLLIDSNGKVGRQYLAKTTPHMFIIDPTGRVVYQGAIDSISSADSSDIPEAENYVSMALDQALAGKPIAKSKTQPYGCSVKY